MRAEEEALRKLIATPDLPELGPGPRSSVKPLQWLSRQLDEYLERSQLPTSVHQPIRAAVLLWHDHLDESHRISQELHGPDGSYLHGIMHRREPDYGNAKYWFQRVGKHPNFEPLARKAAELLESQGAQSVREQLIPGGEWAPFVFVDACEGIANRPSAREGELLRSIQAIEIELLLERFLSSSG
jgi:hypothetical protein